MGEHPALAAVVFGGAWSRRVQRRSGLKLGHRPGVRRLTPGSLGKDEARVVGLGGAGEAEFTADLEQLVTVIALPRLARGRDRLTRARGVTEAGQAQPAVQVKLSRVLAVGEVLKTASRQVHRLAREAAPVGGVGPEQTPTG